MSNLEKQTTFGLIFEKFLKSKPGIVGIIMLIVLAILSAFTYKEGILFDNSSAFNRIFLLLAYFISLVNSSIILFRDLPSAIAE